MGRLKASAKGLGAHGRAGGVAFQDRPRVRGYFGAWPAL